MNKPKFTDEEILRAVKQAGEHPTVKHITERLAASGFAVSEGTVQVYLNRLMEQGLVSRAPEEIVGKNPAWLYEVRA